jgi:iron complex transport system substrate-binding protein
VIRLLATLVVLGASLATSPAAAVTLRDMLGHEVTLSAPPRRIVSLVPSVTEIIYALGAEERLAGRTDYCEFPAAAKRKPSVGGMVNPSLEALVALKPDLVIATDEGNREETFQQLARLRIPTYLVHATRLGALEDMIARIGALTGRQAAVGPLTESLTRRMQAVRQAVAPFPRPRVLYVIWPEPLIVPGRQSLLTELIDLAGGDSVTSGQEAAYVRFSVEAAVALAPQVIVLADHASANGGGSSAGRPEPEKWKRFASVPAIRAGRLYSVDLSILHRYGPSVVEGLETLARLIHPEAFR